MLTDSQIDIILAELDSLLKLATNESERSLIKLIIYRIININ